MLSCKLSKLDFENINIRNKMDVFQLVLIRLKVVKDMDFLPAYTSLARGLLGFPVDFLD